MNGAIHRREFIALLGGAATCTFPLTAHAQQKPPVIGFLSGEPDSPWMRAFLQGVAESGLAEGRDVTVERRFAHGQEARLPALAADLIACRRGSSLPPASRPCTRRAPQARACRSSSRWAAIR
jgi:putative ABC transport system substrate-binding protein